MANKIDFPASIADIVNGLPARLRTGGETMRRLIQDHGKRAFSA